MSRDRNNKYADEATSRCKGGKMIKVMVKNQAKSSHTKKNHTEKKNIIIVCGDYIIILHANVVFYSYLSFFV